MKSSQFKDLNEFLAKHSVKNLENTTTENNLNHTHTRIGAKKGDNKLNIYPGSYIIPNDDKQEFYNLYYDHIFVKKKKNI
jgi:hypothetical protein